MLIDFLLKITVSRNASLSVTYWNPLFAKVFPISVYKINWHLINLSYILAINYITLF